MWWEPTPDSFFRQCKKKLPKAKHEVNLRMADVAKEQIRGYGPAKLVMNDPPPSGNAAVQEP